jgi:hypothetical protein
MNRAELEEKLAQLGVPDDMYSLEGLADGERYCVVSQDGSVRLVYSERGRITYSEDHPSLESAYAALYSALALDFTKGS